MKSNPVIYRVSNQLAGKRPERLLHGVLVVRIVWGEAVEEAACFTAMSKLLNPHLDHELVILGPYDRGKVGNCAKRFDFSIKEGGDPPTEMKDFDNPRFRYLSQSERSTLYVDSDMCPHQALPWFQDAGAVTFSYGITMLDWMMRNSHIAMGEEAGQHYNWFDAEALGISMDDFINQWLFFPLLRINAALLYCNGTPEGREIYANALDLHERLCTRDKELFYFGSGEIALTTICKKHPLHQSLWSRNPKWNATHPLLKIDDFSLVVNVENNAITGTRSMNDQVVFSHLGCTSIKDPDFKRMFGKLSPSGWPVIEVRQGLVTVHDS